MARAPGSPCRLYVCLAREAPLGVVLRRGPSAWARLSLWQTDTDAFQHGQWFHGRVYERRCDLSPDGSLFVYFARKDGSPPSVGVDSWAAISRPPWFTALALWGIGSTYFAGGFFLDDRSLLLGGIRHPPDQGALPSWLRLTSAAPYVDRTSDWTSRTVYVNRLLRDGWAAVPSVDHPQATWERVQPGGRLTLVMAPALDAGFETYGGRQATEYAVSDGHDLRTLGRATWADWDQRGRLILAQDGRLLHVRDADAVVEIEDFNSQEPDPQPSPPASRSWPTPKRDRGTLGPGRG